MTIHFYFTPSNRMEGLSRIVSLMRENFEHVAHPTGYAKSWRKIPNTLKTLRGPAEHPNHALDLGGILLGGMDVVTVPDLIPWVHRKKFNEISGHEKDLKTLLLDSTFPRFHRGLIKARRVVAISEQTRIQLLSLGYKCDEIIHLPLSEPLNAIRQRLQRRNEQKRNGILVVGNNHPRKRFQLAVKAAFYLGKKLTWVGTDLKASNCAEYEIEIAGLAADLGVEYHRVKDATDGRLALEYMTHKLLLVTSPWEGFYLPIPEALAFGLPVVALNIERNVEREPWVENIYRGAIPIATDWAEIPGLAGYDAYETFDSLNDKMGLTDIDRFVERYRRIYEQIGALDICPTKIRRKARLNLGCGPNPKPGYINVDFDTSFGEVTHDLNMLPWPFQDNSVDEVRAFHVLEHLANPFLAAKEIHRILMPGGRFLLQVPHELSKEANLDWGHVNPHWNLERIKWLAKPTEYANDIKFRLIAYKVDGEPMRIGNITAVYRKEWT